MQWFALRPIFRLSRRLGSASKLMILYPRDPIRATVVATLIAVSETKGSSNLSQDNLKLGKFCDLIGPRSEEEIDDIPFMRLQPIQSICWNRAEIDSVDFHTHPRIE